MDDLVSRMRDDRYVGETSDDHRMLADDNFKLGHQQFLTKLATDDSGLGKDAIAGLAAMGNEERAEAKEHLKWEGRAHAGVMFVAGATLSLATGGAATPAAVGMMTTVAGSAPDVIGTWQTSDLAAQAEARGQTDAATTEAAKDARNKAIATTIASLVAPGVKVENPEYLELSDEALIAGKNAVIGEAFNRDINALYDTIDSQAD